MKYFLTAALVLATFAPAFADSGSNYKTVRGTPAMNYKMDRVTPGVTPVGAKAPNRMLNMASQATASRCLKWKCIVRL